MNIKADFPHSNTTGKNHVLEQKKSCTSSFLFFTQRNDHSVLNFSSFHSGLVWVFTEDGIPFMCAVLFFWFESIRSVGFMHACRHGVAELELEVCDHQGHLVGKARGRTAF
jgi:hypothetical protein